MHDKPNVYRLFCETFVTCLIYIVLDSSFHENGRVIKGVTMYSYEDAVKQLQESGTISLINFKELSLEDLEELLEEIKKWCVYANGNKEKLENKSKKKDKKKKKK